MTCSAPARHILSSFDKTSWSCQQPPNNSKHPERKRAASFPLSRLGHSTPIASHSPTTCPSSSSSLLDDFADHRHERDLPRSMKATHAMQRHRIWADAITYSDFVKCCVPRGAVEEGKSVHKHVFSFGYRPKTFLLNVLLNMDVRFDLYDDAEGLFGEMPERNVVSWTALVSAYVNKGMNHRACVDSVKARSKKLKENAPLVAVEDLKDNEDHPVGQTAEFEDAQNFFKSTLKTKGGRKAIPRVTND